MDVEAVPETKSPDLGEVVIVVLANALVRLRDGLWRDGFAEAADVVADLTHRCDRYLEEQE